MSTEGLTDKEIEKVRRFIGTRSGRTIAIPRLSRFDPRALDCPTTEVAVRDVIVTRDPVWFATCQRLIRERDAARETRDMWADLGPAILDLLRLVPDGSHWRVSAAVSRLLAEHDKARYAAEHEHGPGAKF